MRIPERLAKFIVDQAVNEPYRQTDVMDTERFARWLNERGLRLSWRTLHYLAAAGILHPIAVLAPAGLEDAAQRLVKHDIYPSTPVHIDLGKEVEVAHISPPPSFDSLPGSAYRTFLWHSFQLWEVEHVARRMRLPIALDASLADASSYLRLIEQLHGQIPESLAKFANWDDHIVFLKVLAVLLAAEPLVITHVDTKIRLRLWPLAEELEGYFQWRANMQGADLTAQVGVSVDILKEWHRKLATAGHLVDPNEGWRTLIRYAPREKRLGLKGKALLAEEFYYSAEILRRYLEQYHQCTDLLEEDDVMHGQQGPGVKQRLYGNNRTGDFDRSVFRQVVRQFDLDPQPRLRWLVEGETEQEFIHRFAERRYIDLQQWGIEVISLHGLGGLESDRTRTLLTISRAEEVFATVTIDYDQIAKNPGILRTYGNQKLLPAGFRVFRPDFEEANFTTGEMAAVANHLATRYGFPDRISAELIAKRKQSGTTSARKAVFSLLNNNLGGRHWGAALADHAYENSPPGQVRNSNGEREIISVFQRQLRARTSNYKFTIEESRINDEGDVIQK